MQVLVMRHAPAQPGADDDPQRMLLERSRTRLQQVSIEFEARLSSVTYVVSSPWRRARDTAELLRPFTQAAAVETTDLLLPGGGIDPLMALLESYFDHSVLLVGHQPLIGRFISQLLDGPSAVALSPSPGEAADLELEWPAAGLARLRRWYQI
ncbi:SixA phosphatase family protein [Marinobacterium litorale]|uniref:SixA phosphatase family protein n=1 Tax=Marinobacterium litorale TaxID=404770 RepID=UPI0004180A4B|nr:hypothetical protein [Marinobacterium litorale]